MFKVEMLRALVNQRLTAVVEEICGVFETTIAEYEDIISRSKKDAEQQHKPVEAFCSAGADLNKDIKQLYAVKEERQEWRSVQDQITTKLPHIKEEPEKYWRSQERPPLQELQKSTFPDIHVNSESEEGQRQNYPHVLEVFPADVQQVLMYKDQVPSELHEERPTLKVGDPGCRMIKEEHPDWSSQDLERDGKDKEKGEHPDWSSQDLERDGKDKEKGDQILMEENRESPANGLAQQLETEGKDCGRAEPRLESDSEMKSNSSDSATEDSDDEWKQMPRQQSTSHLKPANGLQPADQDKLSDSTETEDSEDDWKHSSKPESLLGTFKSSFKSACQTEKTSFCCSTCGKRCLCKEQLRKHTKTHSKETMHCCSECGKQFITKANLKKHIRSHSFENRLNGSGFDKPLICEKVCLTYKNT
ncbi:hypothetical protein Q5P01_012014 [Channa striata]|uniref:C2H2-type domain-containing protein n=1 Tax=Channa striata TaxID=64152 RepID=A0AA88MRL1_CHASR|nr:hypothetical protein Q5P01_012014 [Channa striata]